MSASGDQFRFSEILLTIYGADGVDDFRRRALAVVERLFGGELVCHNEVNLANGASLSALSQPLDGFEALRPAFFDHIEQHPSVQHHLRLDGAESRALKTSDFVSQRRWRNSGIYRDFYRPLADVRYQLTIGHKVDDTLVLFAISRRHRDFSEDERMSMSLLRPHFVQAYRNARCRSQLLALESRASRADAEAEANDEALVFVLMHRHALSRREAEVLRELAAGRTNLEIADTLGIRLSTVKTHLEQVFRRLGVNSRTAATLRVLHTLAAADAPARAANLATRTAVASHA